MKIVKQSKPIEELKNGDKILIDGNALVVDAQVLLIDHKTTKEMAIECYSQKTDKDYQVRYFTGRLDISEPELYELQGEIQYVKRDDMKEISW
jgi:hypothetical protein